MAVAALLCESASRMKEGGESLGGMSKRSQSFGGGGEEAWACTYFIHLFVDMRFTCLLVALVHFVCFYVEILKHVDMLNHVCCVLKCADMLNHVHCVLKCTDMLNHVVV